MMRLLTNFAIAANGASCLVTIFRGGEFVSAGSLASGLYFGTLGGAGLGWALLVIHLIHRRPGS